MADELKQVGEGLKDVGKGAMGCTCLVFIVAVVAFFLYALVSYERDQASLAEIEQAIEETKRMIEQLESAP